MLFYQIELPVRKAFFVAAILLMGVAAHAQSNMVADKIASPSKQGYTQVYHYGQHAIPVTVKHMPAVRSVAGTAAGMTPDQLVIDGGCGYEYACDSYAFNWRFEYFQGGAVVQNTLPTVLVTSTNTGCWITVNGAEVHATFCDLYQLTGVPDNDPRAPLNNLTPNGKEQLQGWILGFVAKKMPGCVHSTVSRISNDTLYADATTKAKALYAGQQVRIGDMVDVQYANGQTFRFIITAAVGVSWVLDAPSATLLNNTECARK